MGRIARRIAIAVGMVSRRAVCSEFHAARRLCELPNRRIGNAAACGGRWILRECAARRRWASIVINEKNELLCGHLRANVVRSCDRRARFLFHRHSGAVRPGTITGSREFCTPTSQVGMISRWQTAALFDVEKNDCLYGETLAFCHSCSVARVESSFFHCIRFLFECATQRAAIKKQKAKSLRAYLFSFAEPGVRFFTGRRAEPVTAEGERLSQNRKSRFARENVEIEAKISAWRLRPI